MGAECRVRECSGTAERWEFLLLASFHDGRAASRRRRKAFTLIELLVVVAIIALLVTIITPSVSRAKELARQAVCLSNQRSMAGALQAYHAQWSTFPYNYAFYKNTLGVDYLGPNERWALGCLSPQLEGGPTAAVDLRDLDEGEFPDVYICPSADLNRVYAANPGEKYHACYWTNICIRVNRGWRGCRVSSGNCKYKGGLFCTWPVGVDHPPGWDVGSGDMARLKKCYKSNHWRSVYNPKLATVPVPEKTVFTGCTNNGESEYTDQYGTPRSFRPGHWDARPGWGYFHGCLSFDRHNDMQTLSFLDGSASAVSHTALDQKYYTWTSQDGRKIQNGSFLIEYTAPYACDPWKVHRLPQPVVE